ncbi:MAG: hypothetical protein V7641_1608 [Blastocatellia bacterium]
MTKKGLLYCETQKTVRAALTRHSEPPLSRWAFRQTILAGRMILSALIFFLAINDLESQAQSAPAVQFRPDNVESFLRAEMHKRRIPGLQIAVVRRGQIVLRGAYGLANLQDAVPVTNQTVFTINSATKSFTGVAIMQLVEDGKLDLAAPVSRYLENLPATWQNVTIRQLLSHTSGLPNIMDGNARMVADGGDDAAWAKVQAMPLEFASGERFSYNQTNYLLLGRMIDKLSGQPFTQFIAERQFRVVGMPLTAQSGFSDSHDVIPHSARGYTYFRSDKISNVFEEFPLFLRTAAGISATAEEIARWIIALQQGKLLKGKSSLTTLWTPVLLNHGATGGFSRLLNGYALGFPTATRNEHRAVAGIGGGRSAFFIYPDDDLAVVILTNLQGASPESFIDEVAGYYIPAMKAATGFGLPLTIKVLRAELMKRGFEHALDVVEEVKKKEGNFKLAEGEVNEWGYTLLGQGQMNQAIEIFKLNVSLYPDSANAYDSLGEAYEAFGDRALAIKNYKRSLELDPRNTNAVEHFKGLDSGVKPDRHH